MCFLSGRFDAVEDLFLIPNLPSAARHLYYRCMPLDNSKSKINLGDKKLIINYL